MSHPSPPDTTTRGRDLRTISLVGLAHGTSHFFHMLLPPLFPVFKESFGLSYAELGLLVTLFFVISGIGQALAGFLVDRVGARPVLFAALGCFAASAASGALAQGYGGLLLGLHLERYGRLISGDSYVAMKHGPVPSGTYDIMKAVRGDGTCAVEDEAQEAFTVDGRHDVIPRREANEALFSESDLECLREAITRYGSLSFKALTDLSHDAAWDSADENDIIELEQIIATLSDGASLLEHLRR